MKSMEVYFMPHPPLALSEIGQGKEKGMEATLKSMDQIGKEIHHIKPDTILYISPHGNSFSNGISMLYEESVKGDFSAFGHENIATEKELDKTLTSDIYDALSAQDLTSVLLDDKTANRYKVSVSLDHGVLVPMHFIDRHYKDYQLVHLTPSNQSLSTHYHIGVVLKEVMGQCDKKVVVICSGDLSHALKDDGPYDFHPYGQVFDQMVNEAITFKDPSILMNMDKKSERDAAQCGLRSFMVGFGLMDGHDYKSDVTSYEGPFGVGYLTGYLKNDFTSLRPSYLQTLEEKKQTQYEELCEKEDGYIRLARAAINKYVKEHRKLNSQEIKEVLQDEVIRQLEKERAGAFVSIHKDHQLRGCVGTTEPTTDHLLDEIIYCAISACSSDPRFNPVEVEELMDLEIKVDRLYPSELVMDMYELDHLKYGVIVEKGRKRGLLLPRLEGVETVEQQIKIAKEKAGIYDDQGLKIYRFEVERHEVNE